MVARLIWSIPKDQPDFGDSRTYAPGHVEVFEEETGEVLGVYDPMTQPITVLMDLVHKALEDRRRPDWMTLPTCPIPKDLQAHVYAIDHRGWAWTEEDEFPEGVHVDQLRAYLAALSPDDDDEEVLRLPLDEAIALPEAELRRCFEQILIDFTDYPTKKEFPPDFPWDASRLTRDEILNIVQIYAYWFDPDRGHPHPSRQRLRTYDSRQREFSTAAGTIPRLDS
jgi:hypothetical protein